MQLLKTIVLAASFMILVASSASAIPPCPSNTTPLWTECAGTYTWPDGSKYVGEWKDGEPNGQGTVIWPDGSKYVGGHKDGKQNGQGTHTRPDGSEYVGGHKDGEPNGQGTHTRPDGSEYDGEWKDGKPNGQGTGIGSDGSKYVGEWKDGKKNGQGTGIWPNGSKFVGKFKENERNGQGTQTWPNGSKYVGEWKDGEANGQGSGTGANGSKYIGGHKDNKRSGQGFSVATNGKANFCNFINGKASNCVGNNIHNVAPALKSYFSSLSDSQRKEIQRELGGMGYYESAIDGLWGRNTFTALVSFAGLHLNTVGVRDHATASNVMKTLLQDAAPQVSNSNETSNVASGTGFYVSGEGHIITNNHVIDGCKEIKIFSKGKVLDTVVISADSQNDLALLKSNELPAAYFPINAENAYPLQDVIVAGFPFGDRVSSSLKFTQGIISAMSGIGDNYSQIQIDAAIQPGSSGGPILDGFGNVIAVAVSKLDMKKILDDYGVIPENTNFGIKASAVLNLMEGNGIKPTSASKKKVTKYELSQLATEGTVFLTCWMTTAQIDRFKSRKVMFNQFD